VRVQSHSREHRASSPDPETRKRFGQYYTPGPIVRALHRWLRASLSEDGLSPGDCALVDPACGPGAFFRDPAASAYRARLGLDLDGEALAEARGHLPDVQLLRGDAYGDGLVALVKALSGKGPVAVIGNPPYVGNSALLRSGKYHEVRDRLLPFARDVQKRASIRDDYVLFFGVADRLIEESGGRGAIAFVTSATFVDNFLYAPLRRWLLSRYRLHTLVAAGPELFSGARVATALSVWTRSAAANPSASFRHARLEGHPDARLAALEKDPVLVRARPDGERLLLNAPSRETRRKLERMRAAGDRIGEIPRVSFPGLKTRFDELLTDIHRGTLCVRMQDFFTSRDAGAFARRHGLPEEARGKLEAAFAARGRTSFDAAAVRAFARYRGPPHRFQVPGEAMGYCYLDRHLIPRGDHRLRGAFDPHRTGPKLVFNVREVPLCAAVVPGPACVHDYRHTRFAPLIAPESIPRVGGAASRARALGPESLNLSAPWVAAARLLREPSDVLFYLCGVVNSRLVQETFAPHAGASEELPVPRPTQETAGDVQALADAARAAPAGGRLSEDAEKRVEKLFGLA
jgi:hypothetical protein